MTYSDLRPMLESDPGRQTLALARIANLASQGKSLSVDQAADAVASAVSLIDLDSPHRSPSDLVRLQALIALRAIGARSDLVASIPSSVRSLAFSALCCIPTARVITQEVFGCLSNEINMGLREKDSSIRNLCESVAVFFAESGLRGISVSQLEQPETDPSQS